MEAFRSIVGVDNVKTSPDELEAYNVDWMKKYRGASKVAVLPNTTEDVSRVLHYCNERHLPVVPQGGNTGLVGGSVPTEEEVVLSTSRMNKIVSFDPLANVLVCEASTTVDIVNNGLMAFKDIFGDPTRFSRPLSLYL